jgi:ABC-type dipeptide/oligopeptide/nickel transport system permease subunit
MVTTLVTPSRARTIVRLLRITDKRFLIGSAIVLVMAIASFVIPAISPYGPNEIIPPNALSGPTFQHVLGSDDLGRDVLVRVMAGSRISLGVAIGSGFIAVLLGVPLGLIAGFSSGVVDNLIMRPLDVLMAFPAILLAVVIVAFAGTGTTVLIIAIGVVYTPVITRVMRATTMASRTQTYVDVARARGASTLRILVRHVLPNSIGPVVVQASLLMGFAILLEAAFSFIGLGVRPPNPSLGSMLASERDFLAEAPWVIIAPGVAVMVLVLGFNFIGDGLRDALDPLGRARTR